MQILSRISSSLDGARTVGSTDFVKYTPVLLNFATTRPLTWETLYNLALLLDEAFEFFLRCLRSFFPRRMTDNVLK
jgi:hypothetical protein